MAFLPPLSCSDVAPKAIDLHLELMLERGEPH